MALGGLGPQWAVYDADVLPAFKDKPVNERFGLCPWGLYHIEVKRPEPAQAHHRRAGAELRVKCRHSTKRAALGSLFF